MTEGQVRDIVGVPSKIVTLAADRSPTPPWDTKWTYAVSRSTLSVVILFWKGQLSAVEVRRALLDSETLFLVQGEHRVEKPRFRQFFCRE